MSDEKDQGKIVDLEVEKAKRIGNPNRSPQQIRREILRAITEKHHPFDEKFHAVRYPSGSTLVFMERGDGELIIDNGDYGKAAIARYCHYRASTDIKFQLSASEIESVYNTWRLTAPLTPLPQSIRLYEEPGYCFRRVPFQLKDEPAPTWNELFSKISNARAVKAFLGSIFVPESYMQQYLWMKGEGGDGKGVMGRWLKRVLEQSFHITAEAKANNFWLSSLIGKRVCVFSDWRQTDWVTSSTFKNMSGGDALAIEAKYKDQIVMDLQCKYIFFSNFLPEPGNRQSDLRRLIFSEIAGTPGHVKTYHEFEERLWRESAGFILDCIKTYHEECPKHGPINCQDNSAADIAESGESYFQGLLDSAFQTGGNGFVKSSVMANWMWRKGMTRHQDQRNWYEFLRAKGIKNVVVKMDGKSQRGWHGIIFKLNS